MIISLGNGNGPLSCPLDGILRASSICGGMALAPLPLKLIIPSKDNAESQTGTPRMRPEQFPSWRIEEGDASKIETQAPRPLGRSLAARSNTGFRDSRKVEQRHPAFKRYAPSNLPAGNGEPSTVTASDAMHWNLAFAGLMLY